MPKAQLLKRLRYLWTVELAFVFITPILLWVVALMMGTRAGLMSYSAATLMSLILLQGSYYWWIRLAATKADMQIPVAKLRPFRPICALNWMLLVLWWGLVLYSRPHTQFEWSAGLFLWTFALLEQINYYYVQLMYDTKVDIEQLWHTKRLRTSSLRRQLKRLSHYADN